MSTTPTTIVPIEDTSLTGFYKDMTVPEKRTFWACATGWALDGMDFMIYPLVIGTIIQLWNVDPGTAGLAGTVTLLASALGGWGAGYPTGSAGCGRSSSRSSGSRFSRCYAPSRRISTSS
jgi:MFS family permease